MIIQDKYVLVGKRPRRMLVLCAWKWNYGRHTNYYAYTKFFTACAD